MVSGVCGHHWFTGGFHQADLGLAPAGLVGVGLFILSLSDALVAGGWVRRLGCRLFGTCSLVGVGFGWGGSCLATARCAHLDRLNIDQFRNLEVALALRRVSLGAIRLSLVRDVSCQLFALRCLTWAHMGRTARLLIFCLGAATRQSS